MLADFEGYVQVNFGSLVYPPACRCSEGRAPGRILGESTLNE